MLEGRPGTKAHLWLPEKRFGRLLHSNREAVSGIAHRRGEKETFYSNYENLVYLDGWLVLFVFFKGAHVFWIGLYLATSKIQCVVPESVEDIRISLLSCMWNDWWLSFLQCNEAERSTTAALLEWSGNCLLSLSDEQVAALLVQRGWERERKRKRGVNSVRLPQLCLVSAIWWMLGCWFFSPVLESLSNSSENLLLVIK